MDFRWRGVVLVSDGADNGGTRYDDALLALRAVAFRVYTVGVGRERFDRDLAVERVQAPRHTLAGATVLVEADVRVRGIGRDMALISVEADGRVVSTDTVKSPDTGDQYVRLRVPPLSAGVHRLAVARDRWPTKSSPKTTSGKPASRCAGADRVLYVEGEPRPEFAFLRQRGGDRQRRAGGGLMQQCRTQVSAAGRARQS
ncbi:MAG: hypothetical protein IPP90_13250 [Gemmatimonadaceae bacterium]|nr:hypothetical protein [Gemmatimonadaceae bacterium]